MAQNKPRLHRTIRLTAWNANGLWAQLPTFKHFRKENNIDIALINETHLKPYYKFKIRNYQIIRTDRPGIKGGTAIIIKSHIPYENITIPKLQTIEATGIKILTKDHPLICIAAYKRPKIQIHPEDFIELNKLGPRILIAGDLNAKHPEWHSRTTNQAGTDLHDALPRIKLIPTAPTEPTHFPHNGGRPDVLDMILYRDATITDGHIQLMT